MIPQYTMTSVTDSPPEARGYYKIPDLLKMHHSLPYVIFNIDKLTEEGRQASVVDIPKPVRANPRLISISTRELSDIKAESLRSNSSSDNGEDCVVYKGINNRRFHHNSWQYRRRESSERSTQPVSAPTELAAQRADNFQKFFRAVASPTHVRVTAGGRIVPNIQAPPQPMFTWNKEKMYFEPFRPSQGWAVEQASGGLRKPDFQIHPSFEHIGVSSLPTENENPSTPKVLLSDKLSAGQEIKLSPPHQFDATLPFYYNNQMVFPVQSGFPSAFIPVGMIGNRLVAGLPTHPHPEYVPHQGQLAYSTFASPFMMPVMGHHYPGMNPSFMPVASMPAQPPPSSVQPMHHVPIQQNSSSTVPASITTTKRNILANLRLQLKHLEHQLAHNVHQIDVAYTQEKKDSIKAQIKIFENELESLTKIEKPISDNETTPSLHRIKSSTVLRSTKVEINDPEDNGASLESNLSTPKTTHGSSTKSTVNSISGDTKGLDPPRASEQGKRTKLTIDSAKAPPFQPRCQTTLNSPLPSAVDGGFESKYSADELTNPNESMEEAEARLLSMANTWNSQAASCNAAMSRYYPSSLATNEAASIFSAGSNAHSGYGTMDGSIGGTLQLPASNFPLPYLVGCLPPGISSQKATSRDYIYGRELTDAEKRSRQLYWGNTPREKGLPKFDGKDFYPASPIKQAFNAVPWKKGTSMPGSHEPLKAWSSDTEGWFCPRSPKTVSTEQQGEQLGPTHDKSLEYDQAERPDDKDEVSSLDSWGLPINPEPEGVYKLGSSEKQSNGTDNLSLKTSSTSKRVRIAEESVIFKSLSDETSNGTTKQLRYSPTRPSFLQDMLRSSQYSSKSTPPLSVSVSATNAVGYLPQYAGTAAASLAPALGNINTSIKPSSRSEPEVVQKSQLPSMTPKLRHHGENLPLVFTMDFPDGDSTTAVDYLRKLARQGEPTNTDLGWNSKTTGVGPVMDGDW